MLIVAPAREDLGAQKISTTATVSAPRAEIEEPPPERAVIRPAEIAEVIPGESFDVDLDLGAAVLSRWELLPGTAPAVVLTTFAQRRPAAGLEGAGGDFDYPTEACVLNELVGGIGTVNVRSVCASRSALRR